MSADQRGFLYNSDEKNKKDRPKRRNSKDRGYWKSNNLGNNIFIKYKTYITLK